MEITASALYQNLLEDLSLVGKSILDPHKAPNAHMAAKYSIANSLLKKLESDNSDKADSAALLKFLDCNFAARNWHLQLNSTSDQELWGEFKRSLYRFWFRDGEPLADSDTGPLMNGSVGPGSSIGALDGSFYSKMFVSRLSSTSSGLYEMYKNYVSYFPLWRNAEEIRSHVIGDYDIVEGSRLSFVPKTVSISRTICTEPSLNMYYQLGFGSILTSRIKQFYGIDLVDQQFRNRDLARIGSMFDSNVTIDLASASDSISVRLCKEILPDSFLSRLTRYRCSNTEIPGLGLFELDIISSMGNGFTFPLQTLIFCAMVNASFVLAGESFPRDFNQKLWGVFGDDIIVPKGPILSNLLRLLKLAGFVVNDSKSFFEGPFRESCGADYYLGHEVRGVYIRRLSTKHDLFVAINRLNHFSMKTGIHLPRTVQYILGFVPRVFVPLHESDDSGVKVPLTLARFGISRVGKDENGSICYEAYRPSSRKIRFTEQGIKLPRFLSKKAYFFNPYGALLSFLQRSLDACSVSIRHDSLSYTRRTLITPNWDMNVTTHPLSGWIPWQRLGDAVYYNIMF